jgi:hypothetical protein
MEKTSKIGLNIKRTINVIAGTNSVYASKDSGLISLRPKFAFSTSDILPLLSDPVLSGIVYFSQALIRISSKALRKHSIFSIGGLKEPFEKVE